MFPPLDAHEAGHEHEDSFETPQKANYRKVGWFCVGAAIAHVAALLLILYVARVGDLSAFTPTKLMRFVPDHQLLWRSACLASSISSVSTVLVFLALNEIVAKKARLIMKIALVLAVIGCASDLQSHFSMMVLFSDLATQVKLNGTYVRQELVQLSWVTINQALSQTLLLTNLLYSIAGILTVTALLRTKIFPQWLFWMGLPLWLISLSSTAVAFAGRLTLSLSLLVGSVIGFIVWTVAIALVLDLRGNPDKKERSGEQSVTPGLSA